MAQQSYNSSVVSLQGSGCFTFLSSRPVPDCNHRAPSRVTAAVASTTGCPLTQSDLCEYYNAPATKH